MRFVLSFFVFAGGLIPPTGLRGRLRRAIPIDACEPLVNMATGPEPLFAVVERGNCLFDVKVLNVQEAGYSAAIVFNNEDGRLITSKERIYVAIGNVQDNWLGLRVCTVVVIRSCISVGRACTCQV